MPHLRKENWTGLINKMDGSQLSFCAFTDVFIGVEEGVQQNTIIKKQSLTLKKVTLQALSSFYLLRSDRNKAS